MKKRKLSSLIIILILTIGILVITFPTTEVNEVIKSNIQNINNYSSLSIMLETNTGSGSYEMSSNSTWPINGYMFNKTLSKCENGGKLSYDVNSNQIILKNNKSDKCYIYFDKALIVEYIEELYTTNGENNLYLHNSTLENGANDNSIRYAGGDHSLTAKAINAGYTKIASENANDTNALINYYCNGTKRYVGFNNTLSCPNDKERYYTVADMENQYASYYIALEQAVANNYLVSGNINNYVCFGSDNSPCPADNLYRIIGVFDDRVKLIKYDIANNDLLGDDGEYNASSELAKAYSKYAGNHENLSTYYWNYKKNNATSKDWETSLLNTTNLNTNYINYLNNINPKWVNMIDDTTWNIGDSDVTSATAKGFLDLEKAKQTSAKYKIGLMSPSDYGFSASSLYWENNLSTYQSNTEENWMFLAVPQWTMMPSNSSSFDVYIMYGLGSISPSYANSSDFVRPVFFLNSTVTYVYGSGSKDNPIRIN